MKSLLMLCSVLAACLGTFSARAQTQVDLRSQTKSVDFSGASFTKPSKTGTTLPPHCGVGEYFFKTDAAAGSNVFGCTATDVWTGQSSPSATYGGDVFGVPAALRVRGLQGRPISATAPSDGQVLRFNNTTSVWEPGTPAASGGAAIPNYAKPFNAAATVTMLGAEHGLGTANLVVSCYDNATPASAIEADSVKVHPATFDVTVTFAQAQSGKCVVNGTGPAGGGGSGGGAVANVFGRVGGILSQTGDYAFGQISGTAGDAQIAPGIGAAKIGGGTVSNAAFGMLANVSGDIQGQLNGKSPATHSHTGGGDLSGDITNATVARIQNFGVSAAAPSDGQALIWSQANGRWQPQAAGSGGGASMTSQLGDFGVVWTSGTVLTAGANCSSATPCNFRFGSTVYSVTSSSSATLGTASGGIAYFYLTSDGLLNAGTNLPVTCSAGCSVTAGVTGFPANSIPLFAWTALNSAWDANGGRDYRGFLSGKSVIGGTGTAAVDLGAQTSIGVDTAVVPTYLTAVASLTFPSVGNGACSPELSMTLAGAAAGDAIAPGWPGGLPAGVIGSMRVTGANTVGVQVCNLSGAGVSPAAMAFRAAIVRSF
ncbi:MAG: hypothetical protein M3Z85_09520 [Acidobacteriota bacterium]|nr:hypothetical protein [Acidobacteriota bacterium]